MRLVGTSYFSIVICLTSFLLLFETALSTCSVKSWTCRDGQCSVSSNQWCGSSDCTDKTSSSKFCSQRKWKCKQGICLEIDPGCFKQDLESFSSSDDICRNFFDKYFEVFRSAWPCHCSGRNSWCHYVGHNSRCHCVGRSSRCQCVGCSLLKKTSSRKVSGILQKS